MKTSQSSKVANHCTCALSTNEYTILKRIHVEDVLLYKISCIIMLLHVQLTHGKMRLAIIKLCRHDKNTDK